MTSLGHIERAMEACGLCSGIKHITSLGGGCIADVRQIELQSGENLVAKLSPDTSRLQEEADGLTTLASTSTVVVPRVLGVAEGALFLEYLVPGKAVTEDWHVFGEQLAALHHAEAGERYGLGHDNHLGNTPQRNDFHDDWVDFNRTCRFQPLKTMLMGRSLASTEELGMLDRLIQTMGELIPSKPQPSLLHGDLWGGNALTTQEKGIAVIDPAVSVGDGLADIAMMHLFGGFPQPCFDAYQDASGVSLANQDVQTRLEVYRLYHVLNHWVLFGRGYAEQAMGLVRSLCA